MVKHIFVLFCFDSTSIILVKTHTKNDIWEVARLADDLFLTAVKCKLRDRNRVNPVATFLVILKATHQLGDRLTGRVDVPDHPASWL